MSESPPMPDWLRDRVRPVVLPRKSDDRGVLMPYELDDLPFSPRRIFFITGARPGVVRGMHGHRTGTRVLLCVAGEILLEIRSGERAHPMRLKADGVGLLIGPGLWMKQEYVSADAVLAVLTDLPFDEEDYFYEP